MHWYIIFKLSVSIISYFFSNRAFTFTFTFIYHCFLRYMKIILHPDLKSATNVWWWYYTAVPKFVVSVNEKFSAGLESSVHFLIQDLLSGLCYRCSMWTIFSGFAFQTESNFGNTNSIAATNIHSLILTEDILLCFAI
jgi:hypothetical protein